MLYFQAFGAESFWFALLATVGVLLAGGAIYYSVFAYPKPGGEARSGKDPEDVFTEGEHDDPGVPLILKWVYFGFFLWMIAMTYLVATKGWIA